MVLNNFMDMNKMTTKQFLKLSVCSLFLVSGIYSTSLHAASSTDIKNLLTTDSVISKLGLFNTPNDAKFSRADAVVLIDRLLTVNDSSFNQDMNNYLNPFGDVNPNADYFDSLMRLAYYRVGDTTIISKENEIFRPLDFVSRQEFLKMAMLAFNVPLNVSSNLKNFKDSNLIIGKWSERYFSSAVSNGIVVGDKGSLKPTARITTTEAGLILNRLTAKFSINKSNANFLPPESVDVNKVLSNFIGIEYDPDYYDMTAEPIVINDIKVEKDSSKCASPSAVVLSAVAAADTKTGKAAPYFWWSVSDGYLGKYADDTSGASFQKVCFYPATTIIKNYQVTVNGSDNLGFVDKKTLSFASKTLFSKATPKNIAAKIDFSIPAITEITAGREFILDLSNVKVMEQNVNVALENLEVILTLDNQTISLFKGVPYNNQLPISIPTLDLSYGKKGTLQINAYTQSATATKQFKNVVYLPQFVVKGLVINNSETAPAAKSIQVNSTTVELDDSNHFFVNLPSDDFNNKTVNVDVIGGDKKTNYFETKTVTLSYDSPVADVLLMGDSDTVSETDSDADGMTDSWETQYGLNPNDADDALLDFDEDSISNLDEFKTNADPTTAAFLKVTANAGDTQVTLSWKNLATISAQSVCYTTTQLQNALDCENSKGATLLKNQTNPAVINNLINGKKYYFVVTAENANGSFANSSVIAATPKQGEKSTLNDTGITTCSDNSTNGLACPINDFPNQDAQVGRDKTKNDDSDGHAGFSFTKISSSGKELPASATEWNCVKDNVTGLTWEIKTTDGGLHDVNNRYSWYEPDNSKNGGNAGTQNGGSCKGSDCDTNAYVKAVNAVGYCGYKDWRMPTDQELISIVDFSRVNPAIDTTYFPNTQSNWFWSSSPLADYSYLAWFVDFFNGGSGNDFKDYDYNVRLVR
jgi:hypothetical protein